MLGGMLAGTDQGGGEIKTTMHDTDELIYEQGGVRKRTKEKHTVQFYGMSSTAAQEKHGGTKQYRASEGRVVQVPYRGNVEPIIRDILGGIRSTCTYVGAKSLKELSKRTTFVRCAQTHNSVYEKSTIGN